MKRILYWSAAGLVALAAACGASGGDPGSDAESRDVPTTDAPRSDARSDGAIATDSSPGDDGSMPLDAATDQDSRVSQDGGVSQDSGDPDGTSSLDGGAHSDGGPRTDAGAAQDASSLTCTAPMADCNANAGDGCETNLTSNAMNCGACGRSCGNAACTNGRCAPETLLDGGIQVQDYALDDNYIYWLNGDPLGDVTSTQIRRMPKAGGTVTTLATGLGPGQAPIQYNAGYLYFGTINPSNNIVMQRMAITGGTRTTLTHWTPNEGAYAVDDRSLYGLDPCFTADATCTMGQDSVVHVPLVGTAGSGVLLAHRPGARVFGADGTYVYWSDVATTAHSTISRIPRAGGTTEVIASNQPEPRIPSLGSDGYVYWVNYCSSTTSPGTVMRARPGMAAERLIADVGCGYQVVSDGVDLYWSGFHPGSNNVYVRHLRIGSTTSDVIVDAAGAGGNIRLDATHLYFTTFTSIRRVRR